jgi:predicted  nucleic acid-binding Zn-ribbon protein
MLAHTLAMTPIDSAMAQYMVRMSLYTSALLRSRAKPLRRRGHNVTRAAEIDVYTPEMESARRRDGTVHGPIERVHAQTRSKRAEMEAEHPEWTSYYLH